MTTYQKFVLYWMNKYMNISDFSPIELQENILKYQKFIIENIDKEYIRNSIIEYEKLIKESKTKEN
jgi:hypothetical protein